MPAFKLNILNNLFSVVIYDKLNIRYTLSVQNKRDSLTKEYQVLQCTTFVCIKGPRKLV